MTETYKAGEHVKIVRSDALYNEELGDQTGLVGTITRTPVHGAGVYVSFPHVSNTDFYYVNAEFVRAGKAPEPVFNVGDRVELIQNYGSHRIGDAGTVTSIDAGDTDNPALLRVKLDNGRGVTAFVTRFRVTAKAAPLPQPKYAKGDWVKVTNYSSTVWDGAVGKVTLVGGYDARDGYSYVIETHESKPYASGGFDEKYLKATTAPRVHKFKVGDWVEIQDCCSMDTCNGTKWEVKAVPAGDFGAYYDLKGETGNTSRYVERNLKATTKPFTPKFKAGDWVEITGYGGGFDGEKLQVKTVPTSALGFYKFEGKSSGYGFSERYLSATTAPVKWKFKVGDLVTFNEKNNIHWQGGKARVIEVKPSGSYPYKLEIIEGPPKNVVYDKAGMTCNLKEDVLEAWVAPHWTESEPINSSVRIGGRTIVKVSADAWLFLYHDGSYSEKIGSSRIRSNEDTRNCLGESRPRYTFITPN